MRACFIVFFNPVIRIRLQLLQASVQFAPKGRGVKFILDGLMEAFANSIGLWMLGLGARTALMGLLAPNRSHG